MLRFKNIFFSPAFSVINISENSGTIRTGFCFSITSNNDNLLSIPKSKTAYKSS